MKRNLVQTAFAIFICSSFIGGPLFAQTLERTPPALPDLQIGRVRGSDTLDGLNKLKPELFSLYEQFSARDAGPVVWPSESGLKGFTSQQLDSIFGVDSGVIDPQVTISITFNSVAQVNAVKKAGATIISQRGNVIYAMMPVSGLAQLTDSRSISSIDVFKTPSLPSPVIDTEPPSFKIRERGGSTPISAPLANEFDKQTLSGKGVIVGIIDSGIDWRHQDFIKADGTSRIIAIWDLFDTSYQRTGGGTGSKPPVYLESESRWLGTVYTNAQINAALKGSGTVNSSDKQGHGTAVAGTAAGNGRATANGVPIGTYKGIAPEADLIIVKAMECTFFSPVAELTSEWILESARSVGKPVVVNMSFGAQFSAHDGTSAGEQFIDSLTGPGKQGSIITIAAGNDARFNLHASGKFAPKRKGQADQYSAAIELSVKSPSRINAVFNSIEDWGIVFRSTNPVFAGTDGKPVPIFIYKNSRALDYQAGADFRDEVSADRFLKGLRLDTARQGQTTDTLQLQLPIGSYIFWGYGTGLNVRDGRFDLYSVEAAHLNKAFFGMGTDKNGIVASPGNAKNAITVGSFDFRDSWVNVSGETTKYNMVFGEPSNYTSAGFRRDGVIKPDISAPGRYTIASLAREAQPSLGGCDGSMASGDGAYFTRDGLHVAWAGTSASTPFTAGVIALMLQKNPQLDAEQVRQILKKTAKTGGTVGSVPNQVWGWGMIDPAAALKAVPVAGRNAKRP